MTTYTETVYRYVIERHEELPDRHKAEYRLNGIDPDNLWSLIWSFKDEDDAKAQLAQDNERAPKHWTYRMRDLGETQYIERQAWF